MQTKHEGILRAVNDKSGKYNVLTAPVHEAYQSNWKNMPHTFYLYQHDSFKDWNHWARKLPDNHVLLDKTAGQIKHDMKFDIVLSQNKFGNYQIFKPIAEALSLPLISLEHTLPVPTWNDSQMESIKQMRGDINIFISEYSVGQWGFSLDDPTVRVIHHGIDSDKFKSSDIWTPDGKILSVVNCYQERSWCCGWNIYKSICLDNNMPTNPIGATPGFSEPTNNINELIEKYQNASVFFNTSTISPIPTSLLEAMSCGVPVVSTSTCMIPEIVKDGQNGFCSNDEKYLHSKLQWCLDHPEEARIIGMKGRDTILQSFTLEKHISSWLDIFSSVYGGIYA